MIPMIAKDIKNGMVVNYNDAPCIIEVDQRAEPFGPRRGHDLQVSGPQPGHQAEDRHRAQGGESLDEADFERRPVKFMYADATHMHFLDQEDYNQYALPLADVDDEAQFLTESLEGMQALIYNDECVGMQLPIVVELKVIECDPGVQRQLGHQPHQAGHARNRPDRAGARVPLAGRVGQGRHAHRRVSFASVIGWPDRYIVLSNSVTCGDSVIRFVLIESTPPIIFSLSISLPEIGVSSTCISVSFSDMPIAESARHDRTQPPRCRAMPSIRNPNLESSSANQLPSRP